MKILITGAAGFIGFHTARKLLQQGNDIIGIDNINDYYDPNIKIARIALLKEFDNFKFYKADITDKNLLNSLFKEHAVQRIIHLAAQAGVRYSIENPYAYIDSNIIGFINILECARHFNVEHLTYASSSSVYGANENMPFSIHKPVDHPLSLYAATKKSNELFAHSYSHLYNIPTTGLRFFTVYGPWGRPDMALFLFTKAILEGKSIDVFNYGKMKRDFTYITDIVEGIVRVSAHPAQPNTAWNGLTPDPASSKSPYRIYNIGNNNPVELMDFITAIEDTLGIKAKINLLPLQSGDVPATTADVTDLIQDLKYKPHTNIETGIRNFIAWYKEYYKI